MVIRAGHWNKLDGQSVWDYGPNSLYSFRYELTSRFLSEADMRALVVSSPEVQELLRAATVENLCKVCWEIGEFGSCDYRDDCGNVQELKNARAPFEEES